MTSLATALAPRASVARPDRSANQPRDNAANQIADSKLNSSLMSFARAILALSRPARLPAIWSNCLAGWWLGGGGNGSKLPFLFAGATLLHLGGAFLNDAFDAEFDQLRRPGRPIASGAIPLGTVWRSGLTCLVLGALLLLIADRLAGGIGLAIVLLIILYNSTHRLLGFSPVLQGLVRFFLYVLGASVAEHGVTGSALWCGLALAIYMTGLGYLARWQDSPGKAPAWPAALLVTPILLALLMDVGRYREPALLLSALLILWGLRAWRRGFWALERNLPQAVADLGAGIVFVDWLATCPITSVGSQSYYAPRELSYAFIALLIGTLLLQRAVPER